MAGGNYRIELTYEGPGGSKLLYSGLHIDGEDFQSNTPSDMTVKKIDMESYVYLDTYASGQSGSITLRIILDGETLGNDYQSMLADVLMNFAAELKESEIIITGDRKNPLPYFIAMTATGVVLLGMGIFLVGKRRKTAEK